MKAVDSANEHDANIVIERPSSENEGSPSRTNAATATPSKPLLHPRLHVQSDDSVAYITVSDPTQYTEGIKGKYIMYRVAYDPPPPSANDGAPTSAHTNTSGSNRVSLFPYATSVNRRYSDFSWLFDHLHKERPGAIVPPLPEKQQVSRFTEPFIEERRFHLEIFLRRVVCNPELKDTECLLIFLGGGDAEFKKAQKDWGSFGSTARGGGAGNNGNVDVAITQTLSDEYNMNEMIDASNNGGGNLNNKDHQDHSLVDKVSTKKAGIKKWIKDKKTTMQGSMVRSPDDVIFEQVEHYLSALQVGLKRMEIQASAMVKRDHDVSACLLEFGLACDALAYIEDDVNGSGVGDDFGSSCIGQTYRLIGKTADEISTISADYHDRKLSCFLEPLRDHLKMVHAAKVALSKRNNRRITYSTCINSVDTKKASLHKYRIMQDQKAFGVEASLSRAESEVLVAKANYDEVSARVLREVDRFRRENAVAMYATMSEFARAEKDHTDRMNMIWGVLLPHVEELNASEFNGKSFVQAAAALREGKSPSGEVGGEEATKSVTAQVEHMPMPKYPPPLEPTANGVDTNAKESLILNGVVRYRDPLPGE